MAKGSNYTTILGELSPEMAHLIQQMPRRNSDMPSNVYSESRLLSANCAIRRVISEPDFSMPLHIHDFFVFTYCRQAEGYEYLVGTNRYRLRSGDLIRIPEGVPHRHINTDSAVKPFIRDELWLRRDFLRAFGQRLPNDFVDNLDYLFGGRGKQWEQIAELFEKGVMETEGKAFRWDTMIDGYALILLVSISRAIMDHTTKIIPTVEQNLFDKVMSYLKENLDKKLVPEDVAEQFFVSKSTLNRTFRKHMGSSFYHSVTQLRLLAAQQLMMDGMQLDAVSQKVGFADYPTFYRAFRKEHNISPQQYKKAFCQENQGGKKDV